MKILNLIILLTLFSCASSPKVKKQQYLYKEGQCLNYKGHPIYIVELEPHFGTYSLYGFILGENHWFSERTDYVHWQMFETQCRQDFIERYINFRQSPSIK
jgi:hypothetical protein